VESCMKAIRASAERKLSDSIVDLSIATLRKR
jgi:hypothetical protein